MQGGAAAGVPDTAGAADKLDAGIAGGIIQAHWARVLERCTDPVPDVRHAALKVGVLQPWTPQHANASQEGEGPAQDAGPLSGVSSGSVVVVV